MLKLLQGGLNGYYYYIQNDGNNYGGTRYIAGSVFGVD